MTAESASGLAATLVGAAAEVVRGKTAFLELFTAALLARGHVLVEDLPGLGKTTVAKTFARLISVDGDRPLSFKRIQFTPDLLPYDITGVDVFDQETKTFRFVPGPLFAHVVLADEINRTTPKVQSALLEAMAEGHVTVGGATRALAEPFVVIATQNPVESEGTFPLPAAQLDRFMVRLSLGYPDLDSERAILSDDPSRRVLPEIRPRVSLDDFLAAQRACDDVFCHESLSENILEIVRATRAHRGVSLGASPRSALHLLKAVKALAVVRGRTFVSDEDLAEIAPSVLAHRLKLRDPRLEADTLIRELCFEKLEKKRRA